MSSSTQSAAGASPEKIHFLNLYALGGKALDTLATIVHEASGDSPLLSSESIENRLTLEQKVKSDMESYPSKPIEKPLKRSLSATVANSPPVASSPALINLVQVGDGCVSLITRYVRCLLLCRTKSRFSSRPTMFRYFRTLEATPSRSCRRFPWPLARCPSRAFRKTAASFCWRAMSARRALAQRCCLPGTKS